MYGEGPGECFEGITTLAALERASPNASRLGLLVTGMTYRHPAVFAAEAITIDHASGGRLELVVRRGVVRQGAPPARDPVPAAEGPHRRVRGGDADRARPAHHRRLHVRGQALPGRATPRCSPRPVQQPHPPIWIGASGEKRMMPIAARYADVWHCFGGTPELDGGRSRQRLERDGRSRRPRPGRDHCARRRCRSRTTLDTIAANIDAWEKAGFELPRVRLAGRRSRAGRSVRAALTSEHDRPSRLAWQDEHPRTDTRSTASTGVWCWRRSSSS